MHYTPLVRAVAHRVAAGLPPYVDQSDLVQSGVFGLIDAVIRFDPARCPQVRELRGTADPGRDPG